MTSPSRRSRGSQRPVREAEERPIRLPKRKRGSATPEKGEDDEQSEEAKPKRGKPRADRSKPRREREKPKPGEKKRAQKPAASLGALAKAARSKASGKDKSGKRKPAGTLEKAFTQVLAILGALLTGIAKLIAAGVKALAGPAEKVRKRLAAWTAALSRIVTPTRGLLLAAVGCAVLLALSQFVDYRGISIGADAYDPGISSVAPAPEVERAELGSAHGYAMIPVALLAVAVLWFAVRTGRWQLCRLVVLLGLAAIAVAIFIDRPAGLDEGDLNRDFTGVEAKLLGGFWMQIFAGAGLAFTSWLLGREVKRSGATKRSAAGKRPARRAKPSTGRKTEGKASASGPKAEGASA